jgi:FkbM family methyltransferase
MAIIKLAKQLAPESVKYLLKRLITPFTWDQYYKKSWSQEGEDQILQRIFERQSNGFYVDVGAHHPQRFSNTHLFYKRGWRGINIDAMPGSMKAFNKIRPRDINLEMGVGSVAGQLDYYVFNEPALNGFSKELSHERINKESDYKIEKIIKIDVFPLHQILKNHMPSGLEIDFMTIDVEGLDYEVLKSNDWSSYRPKFVLAEILGSSLHEIDQSPIGTLMRDERYVLYAKCMNTVIFKDASQQ